MEIHGFIHRRCGYCGESKELIFGIPEGKKQVVRMCEDCWDKVKGIDIEEEKRKNRRVIQW